MVDNGNFNTVATEAALRKLWLEVLEIEDVKPDEDFIELGGDSMAASRIILRIDELWAIEVPLADFFEHQTIRELAVHIGELRARIASTS
jgi:acyl carrier protein